MTRRALPLDAFITTSTPSGSWCRICGKALIDPKSINRGIGPTCAQKIGLLRELYRNGTTAREAAQKLDVPLEMLPTFLATLGGIPCQYCDVLCPDKDSLNGHCREVHDRPHPCPEETCNYSFNWPSNARSHFNRRHSNQRPHVCPHEECDYATANAGDLQSHVRHKHRDVKPYNCPSGCGYETKDQSKIYRHLRREACWYQSSRFSQWETICFQVASILFKNKDWRWKPNLPVTDDEIDVNYVEPEIVIFDDNGNIVKIIDAKTSLEAIRDKDVKIYPMLTSRVEFWILSSQKSHPKFALFSVVNSIQISKTLEDLLYRIPSTDIETRQCILQVLNRIEELKLACQSDVTDLSCIKCGRNDFNDVKEIKTHGKNCDGVLRCDYCGKQHFSHYRDYRDHVWVHENNPTCPHCGKNDFEYRSKFNEHIWIHEKGIDMCPRCRMRGFTSKSRFMEHVWIHDNDAEKCPFCGKQPFRYRQHYLDHVWVHENNPTCPHCGKNDFEYKSSFNAHVKKKRC